MQMDASAPLPPAQRNRAQQIAQAGWHLLEMINDTLDLSRLDAGTVEVQPRAVRLAELISSIASHEADAAQHKGLSLRVRVGGQRAWSDPVLLEQRGPGDARLTVTLKDIQLGTVAAYHVGPDNHVEDSAIVNLANMSWAKTPCSATANCWRRSTGRGW